MNADRPTMHPALTAEETLASDLLLHELLAELAGDTVVGLERFRRDAAPAAALPRTQSA